MRPIGRLRLTEAIKEKGTIPCSTGKQSRGPMDKDRIPGLSDGTSEPISRSPRPSRIGVVNPARVRRRRSVLPREISGVSWLPDLAGRKARDRGGESAEANSRRNNSTEGPNGWE
jgi:hypothetical protein